MKKECSGLIVNARKHYGQWWLALEAAGINFWDYYLNTPKGYWSGEAAVQEIRRRYKRGDWSCSADVRSSDSYLYYKALEYCGSVEKIFKELGKETGQGE